MQKTRHLDLETRSAIDLSEVGSFRYAEDPSTEIFCAAMAEGHQEPIIWVNPKFEFDGCRSDPGAVKMLKELGTPGSLVVAHNSMFEASVCGAKGAQHGINVALHQWRCTAAMARRANIPASLEKAAATLGITQQKDTRGKSLIRKFSIPRKDGTFLEPWEAPEDFKAFLEYCKQDVRVEQQIHKELAAFELTGPVLDTFLFDLEMNSRGLPLNIQALRHASEIIHEMEGKLAAEFKDLVGFSHTQTKVFTQWLKDNGYKGDNLRAATITEEMDSDDFDPNTVVGKVLTLRKQMSFAAVKKVKKMLECVCSDGRARGMMVFYGAQTTGRWSSEFIQTQNAKRPTIKQTKLAYSMICNGEHASWLQFCFGPALDVMSSCIRHFIHDVGKLLYDVDYSAIEARILAWLAGEDWKLEVFRTHGKIYEATASRMTGLPFEEFERHYRETGDHHPFRYKGKVAELALGYQGAIGALVQMGAIEMGMEMKELPDVISAWRSVNPNIRNFWYSTERAAKAAIRAPGENFTVGKVSLFCGRTANANYLFIRLPSGRRLCYRDPQLHWERVAKRGIDGELLKDEQGNAIYENKEKLTYFGRLKGKAKNIWGRVDTYGGKLVENITQAVAADVMANGSVNANRAGFKIAALIHDQCLAYDGDPAKLPELCKCLTTLPPWGAGLPVDVDGKVVPFYTK